MATKKAPPKAPAKKAPGKDSMAAIAAMQAMANRHKKAKGK